jgi:hypothetical protein
VTIEISPRRRREIVSALRGGTVPQQGLDVLAVGLQRFETAIDEELSAVSAGGAVFKAVRGEYGAGKTFFSRWLVERARRAGFASAEVQISETETPLHKLETVYRRVTENLATAEFPPSAFREVVDGWFFSLEQDVIASEIVQPSDTAGLAAAVDTLLERRLLVVSQTAPAFASALRGYRAAVVAGDAVQADGLIGWLGGQPHVASSVRRSAGVRGELDHFGAFGFLQGLIAVLRDSGYAGLVIVLDEVETLQRVRGDVRDKALNALRQLVDEVNSGRFPGLCLLITGTPAFFEGTQGVQRLAPLAQRLSVDFTTDPRFDNARAVQIRLPGFSHDSLCELGGRVRDLYAVGASPRVPTIVDDAYIATLATAVAGRLGGKVGVAPRIFLKKLVADVLDRVDQHEDFDPRRDYALTISDVELGEVERQAASGIDDIDLDLDD